MSAKNTINNNSLMKIKYFLRYGIISRWHRQLSGGTITSNPLPLDSGGVEEDRFETDEDEDEHLKNF